MAQDLDKRRSAVMDGPRYIAGNPSPLLLGLNDLVRIKRDQLQYYEDLRARYGDVVTVRLGPYRSHLFFHPHHIEALLTRNWASFVRFKKLTDVIRQWNGDSLLLAEGDEWRARRRKVMPAFQTKRLPGYGDMAVDQANHLRQALSKEATDGRITFDTDATMARLTLDIATRTLFGAAPRSNGDEIEKAIQVLSQTAFRESTSPATLPDWLPLPAKKGKRWAMKVMDDLVRDLIQDRIARGTQGDQNDLLTSLIEQHEGDLKSIRDDVMSLLIAGHETSGALLSWLFTCLADAPDWLLQIQSELVHVLDGRLPRSQDIANLPILRAVVDETLRLYPPAYTLFLRQAAVDVDVGGFDVRKGDLVQVVPFTTQRDARFFDAPNEFNPARFLSERTWPNYAYLPFGAGPRVCIGQNFGLMETCLVAATLLQKMAPIPKPNTVVPDPKFSLRPRGGLRMTWEVVEKL